MQIPAHIRSQALPAAIEATTALTPVLRRYPKASKALSLILAAQATHKALSTLRTKLTPPAVEPERWTVTVKAEDDLYEHALAILAEHSTVNWRAVEAEMDRPYDYDLDTYGAPSVKARPSERAERNITVGGHPIVGSVETFTTTARQAHSSGDLLKSASPRPVALRDPEVLFVAESEAGQAAVLSALRVRAEASSAKKNAHRPKLWTAGGYRGWDRKGELPIRPVDSVAVTDNQVQRIVDDILAFRKMEPEYVRRGIPFHRGYLLYGPPGTGKTSAVKAIAHAVGADLYAANLGTLSDSGLAELVQGVSRSRTGAVLLLEDIDSFGAARQREDDDDGDDTGVTAGISTTGLLNALDGVETPHGLITILTTNHPEFLDDALVRPGRVDLKVFFGYPDNATVERHFEFFFSRKPSVPLYANGRSGAELNEVFVAHMTDPEGAERTLSRPVSAVA